MNRYPEYNDSRHDHIGEIPADWSTSKVKYLADYINGYAFKPDDWSSEGLPIIRIGNLNNPEADFNHFEGEIQARYRVSPGDLLYAWSASLGIYRWTGETDGWVNQHIYKVRVNPRETTEYYYYWLATWFTSVLESETHGSTMQHLTKDKFGGLAVPLPPLDEQRQLAAYLDRKTGEIDTLIRKKQALIALLREHLKSVLNQVVTKGLNPAAPMKEPKIDWLEAMPAHWSRNKLGRLADIKGRIGWRGYTAADLRDEGEGVLVLGASQIARSGQIDLSSPKYLSVEKYEESPEIQLHGGEILIVKVGATIGKVGLIPTDFPPATINPNVMIIRDAGVLTEYLYYYLRAIPVQSSMDVEKGGGAQDAITQGFLSELQIPVPPETEQKNVADFLKTKTEEVEEVIKREARSISLLQELRTSLISEVVTGKIDVRGEVPASDATPVEEVAA